MEYVYLVIMLALVEYLVFGGLVGAARGKYAIKAPAVTGNEVFERTFRVHQNTLEGLIVFVPAIWIFATYLSTIVAAIIGLVVIVGRAIYARSYIADPESRGLGAMICGLGNMVLVLGALIGVILALI
jgi:glutathione S-transferase